MPVPETYADRVTKDDFEAVAVEVNLKLDEADATATYRSQPRESMVYLDDFGAVGNDIADDTSALLDARDAVVALGGGIVQLSGKRYHLAGALRTDKGGRAQIPLPNSAGHGPSVRFRGVTPMENYNPNDPNGGSVLRSSLTGQTFSGTYGAPSVIGGPTIQNNAGAYSYIDAAVENLAIELPATPTVAGVDLLRVGRCELSGVIVIAKESGGEYLDPNGAPWAFGFRLPGASNFQKSRVKSAGAYGMFAGIVASTEHPNIDYFSSKWCRVGYGVTGDGAAHATSISKLSTEWCTNHIAGYNEETGVAALSSPAWLTAQLWDIEDAPLGEWYSTDYHLNDSANNLRGQLAYFRVSTADGIVSPLVNNGAAYIKTHDLSAQRRHHGQQVSIEMLATPLATGGTWIAANDAGTWFGGHVYNDSGANGDYIEWLADADAGLWTCNLFTTHTTFCPIVDLSIDGVVVGTVDLYNGSTTRNRDTFTDINIPTSGTHQFRVTVNGKHGSSGGYNAFLSRGVLTRTG